MRNILTFILMAFFLLTIMPIFVNAEMWLWEDTIISYNNNLVTKHGYYQFEDTSASGIGRDKPIGMVLWYVVEGLPYNLTAVGYAGEVDWCNFTIQHDKSSWEISDGQKYLNRTIVRESYYFQNTINSSSAQLYYELKDRDSLVADMVCHYTDSSSVFIENTLFGRWTTYFGAYECMDCEEYSLEELSNQIERNEDIIEEETEVYEKIQSIIDMNYQLWLIVSWIIKIGFVMAGIGLIFSGVYYLYNFFKDIERQI